MRARLIAAGAVGLFTVIAALALAANRTSSSGDAQGVTRSWGLEVTARLSPTQISTSQTLHLHAEIRNLRPVAAVQKDWGCTALVPAIWDSRRRLMWQSSFGCGQSSPLPTLSLEPGQATTQEGCYTVVRSIARCIEIPFRVLQPGTYTIGGTLYGQKLPELKFRITTDDLFDSFLPGDLVTPLDGQYMRSTRLTTDLIATTTVKNLQLPGRDLMVLEVLVKNIGADVVHLPVRTCDDPFVIVPHSNFDGQASVGHLTDNYPHATCDGAFKPSTEAIAPGQALAARECYDSRVHMASGFLCISLYERSTARFGIRVYGYDLPEFSVAVNR